MHWLLAVSFTSFVGKDRITLYFAHSNKQKLKKANGKKTWVKLTAGKQPIWCFNVFLPVLISWVRAAFVYILNTPNLGSPIGAFKAELKLSPRTVRVSTGSMTPSSHNLQQQEKEWSVFTYKINIDDSRSHSIRSVASRGETSSKSYV